MYIILTSGVNSMSHRLTVRLEDDVFAKLVKIKCEYHCSLNQAVTYLIVNKKLSVKDVLNYETKE